jgi:hypothetical protein
VRCRSTQQQRPTGHMQHQQQRQSWSQCWRKSAQQQGQQQQWQWRWCFAHEHQTYAQPLRCICVSGRVAAFSC